MQFMEMEESMAMDAMNNRKKWGKWLWHALPLAALLVWGAFCITDQLWYDEAFSAGLVMQPWKKMIYITAVDDHSPFYYMLLKLFYHLCGGGTHFKILKLFSLLFMIGYMLLGKYYVSRLFNQEISVWFMLFSLCMPIMSVQAGNVRMYSMALFFMTLAGLLAYDIYREESRSKWILFALSSICIVYCHTFAMIQAVWLYLIFMAALIRSRQFQKLKRFFVCGAVVSLVFSPWLVVTFKQMQLRMRYDTGSAEELAGVRELADYCREWFSAVETPIELVVYLGIGLAAVMAVSAVLWMRREKSYAPALGAAAFVLTALTGFLISVFVNNCFMGRYAFPGFGFIMLVYAVGMCRIRKIWARGCVVAVALICLVLQYRSELELEYDGGLEAYESFFSEQVGKEDALIGPHGHAVFLSVYHPDQAYYLSGYVPVDLSFPNLEPCYDIGQLIRERETVWYIAFAGDSPDDVQEGLRFEEAAAFHYMYYDFVIYKMLR
ncbi:MAG: glycosyltransferase family 39 protein [Acetatifactor sp.]|nr:glycosyltransferase family 39 protein [Acetatifactor sp.]